jgi:hypothetical protein
MTEARSTASPDAGPRSGPVPFVDDEALSTGLLVGPTATDILGAVWQPTGARVESTRPTGITYHAGRSVVVEHVATVSHVDGTQTTEAMAMAVGVNPPADALVVTDGDREVVVWRIPADPWLPGMRPALDPPTVSALLEDLGLPSGDLSCHVRAYRPTRRAVVEVTAPGARVFLKVVPLRKAEALHRRHLALHRCVPVPASHGWSPDLGIVVLQALPGRTVRDILLSDGVLPDPSSLVGLRDALPAPSAPESPHGWRLREFATHLGAIVPDLAERTAELATALAPFEAEVKAGPAVPVHGDLHDAQVLVDDHGRITGLLDVDTFRAGRRVEDLATYIGHLVVLCSAVPGAAARIDGHTRTALDTFDGTADPALLRAAVAAVVLGLATGSFRTQDVGWRQHTERRVELAERWLDSALEARTR